LRRCSSPIRGRPFCMPGNGGRSSGPGPICSQEDPTYGLQPRRRAILRGARHTAQRFFEQRESLAPSSGRYYIRPPNYRLSLVFVRLAHDGGSSVLSSSLRPLRPLRHPSSSQDLGGGHRVARDHEGTPVDQPGGIITQECVASCC